MMVQTMLVKRTLLLLTAMLAALVLASGVAMAVNKVCPSGTTEQNPCLGTNDSIKKKKKKRIFIPGKDTLIGTSGPDYIKALSGNDNISGGEGDDTTDGGAGNDTYSYRGAWGVDTLIDASGTDALNFSGMPQDFAVQAKLTPELGENFVEAGYYGASGATLNLSSGTIVEKVTGSAGGWDNIFTGGATNTLQPGPGPGGAGLYDWGGNSDVSPSIPASSDTYSGFVASGYGDVQITDHGGTGDKLVLPFASTDTYFEAWNSDSDPALDSMSMFTSNVDEIHIYGQVEPSGNQKGHIEQIVFTDGTITIGSQTASQTLNAEAQVQKLNEASNLDEAEKQKRKKAAKKAIEAAKEKKAQETDKDQQSPSSSPGEEEKKR